VPARLRARPDARAAGQHGRAGAAARARRPAAPLSARAPRAQGMDVVWEAVGGEMLATGVGALARGGRLVVIGAVSQYAAGWAPSALPPGTPELLLWRSATITGAAPRPPIV
jgi:NADPH-dependent curcumin reductase CurA